MNLSPRWKKLVGDMRHTQGRLAMMVGALALGAFAIAAILGAATILTREMSRNYLGTHPASAHIDINRVDEKLLAVVRHWPEVNAAESGASLLTRAEIKPGTWLPALLFVVPDFEHAQLNRFTSTQGAWPPPDGSVLLERTALALTTAKVGESLQVKSPNGIQRSLLVSGLVHDPGLAPAWQEQTVYGYITPATLGMLGGSATPQVLKIGLRGTLDAVATERAVADIAARLKQLGYVVGEIRIPPPRKHPHQTQMTAILVMLLLFSFMAFALSAVLTATMVGGLLAQQVRQIGVMKAIGARSAQIARIYLLFVAMIGLAASTLGVPLGAAAGRAFARVIAELLNFTLYSEAIPGWAYLLEIAIGVLLPVTAALIPISKSASITVREAISEFGASRRVGASTRLGATLARIRGLDRSMIQALRNTFRRPARLALIVGLLASAGAMFMTSLNVKSAWEKNLADAAADRHYDLEVRLTEPFDETHILPLISAVPGVKKAEVWNTLPAAVGRADGLDIVHTYPDGGHGSFVLRSVPESSTLTGLTIQQGRWLTPGDRDAVVLNHTALALFPGARLGDTIPLQVNGRRSNFTLVGIAREIITPASAYVSPAGFARASGLGGQANSVRIVSAEHSAAAIAGLASAVRQALASGAVNTKLELSETRLDDALRGHVYILIFALLAMSVVMAGVGALGLMSAMGTSVLERTREFGILRTLGGTSAVVLRNVIGEGIFIGLMSWPIALALSLPLSWGIGALLGQLSFRCPLTLSVSSAAIGLWLLLLLAGAALSSAYPAWKASRLTVRETLVHI